LGALTAHDPTDERRQRGQVPGYAAGRLARIPLKRPVWHDICGGCHSSSAPSGLVALSSESIR
jgi:hypothetical protein